jgi:hypothetical protein
LVFLRLQRLWLLQMINRNSQAQEQHRNTPTAIELELVADEATDVQCHMLAQGLSSLSFSVSVSLSLF